MFQDLRPRERSRYNVSTILLDPRDGNLDLCLVQKVEAVLRFFGKVYNPPVRRYTNEAGHKTLDNVHPLPALDTTSTVEVI